MVNSVPLLDQKNIDAAIDSAGGKTTAKINVSIHQSSDHYLDFVLLYAILLGTGVSVILWLTRAVPELSWLLVAQFAVIAVIIVVKPLRTIFYAVVPKSIRHRRASHIARQEFHALHANDGLIGTPFVLLYVSVAERYVHVLTSRIVHEKIPENWNTVTDHFITSMRKDGLPYAVSATVEYLAGLLAKDFPA